MSIKITAIVMMLASASIPCWAAPHIHRGPTAHRVAHRLPKHSKHASAPRAMEAARAAEIQSALIREGYMTGAPSGVWDNATQSAMQKYQADHGWQTRLTPDSRAIIKLGLGSSTTPAAAWVNSPLQTKDQDADSVPSNASASTEDR